MLSRKLWSLVGAFVYIPLIYVIQLAKSEKGEYENWLDSSMLVQIFGTLVLSCFFFLLSLPRLQCIWKTIESNKRPLTFCKSDYTPGFTPIRPIS